MIGRTVLLAPEKWLGATLYFFAIHLHETIDQHDQFQKSTCQCAGSRII